MNNWQTLCAKSIMGGESGNAVLHKQPARLIVALAKSKESPLRLALIPLFLEHPEFATRGGGVSNNLKHSGRLTLQGYYTAAVWFQKEYRSCLDVLIGKKPSLPDYFSRQLGLENTYDPESDLQRLAKRHQILRGAQVNWLGTYQHSAHLWIKGLEI